MCSVGCKDQLIDLNMGICRNIWPICVISLAVVMAAVKQCVVPENIQTSTMEGIGNSREVGGSEAQEIPEGRGVGQ